jgi:hypothetical protein
LSASMTKKLRTRRMKNNHSQDGPTLHTAFDAEKELFGTMETEKIKICTKEDLIIVTDMLTHYLKAFADLHTRSRKDDGEPAEDVSSPRKLGIIDLADAVKTAIASNGIETEAFLRSRADIDKLIAKLSKGSGSENDEGGIRIPKRPDTNCFGGKHVFKASIEQAYPPDPMFVGARGTVNFGRQWGIRLMPECPVESSLDSSSALWREDEGHSDATQPHSDRRILQGSKLQSWTPNRCIRTSR